MTNRHWGIVIAIVAVTGLYLLFQPRVENGALSYNELHIKARDRAAVPQMPVLKPGEAVTITVDPDGKSVKIARVPAPPSAAPPQLGAQQPPAPTPGPTATPGPSQLGPAGAAAPQQTQAGGKCVPVKVVNEMIPSGKAMEYPLWFHVPKDEISLVRDCAKPYDVEQAEDKLPHLRVVQPSTGFAVVSVMNKRQTLFYPHAAGNCVVADFAPGQTEVVLRKAPCPTQPAQQARNP